MRSPRPASAAAARMAASFTLAMAVAGCRPSPQQTSPAAYDANALRGTRALEEVKRFLAVGPRPSGSGGAQRAAAYLAKTLRRHGLLVSIDEFTDVSGSTNVVFRNVLGTIPGRSSKTIVIASHYDTKAGISPEFIGANDSGSSTGLLLELAELLADVSSHPYTVICAFLDGEECVVRYGARDGLHGSRRLAGQLPSDSVVAVIVLDMTGDRDMSITIPRSSSPELISMAFEAAHEHGVRHLFSLAATDILDDHVPFRQAGIPAIDIIDFQFGSGPGKNDYWHTEQDTLDKLSAQSLESIGRVTIGMLNRLIRRRPEST